MDGVWATADSLAESFHFYLFPCLSRVELQRHWTAAHAPPLKERKKCSVGAGLRGLKWGEGRGRVQRGKGKEKEKNITWLHRHVDVMCRNVNHSYHYNNMDVLERLHLWSFRVMLHTNKSCLLVTLWTHQYKIHTRAAVNFYRLVATPYEQFSYKHGNTIKQIPPLFSIIIKHRKHLIDYTFFLGMLSRTHSWNSSPWKKKQ